MVSALIDTQLLRLNLQLYERTTVACPVKPQLNRAGANEHLVFDWDLWLQGEGSHP